MRQVRPSVKRFAIEMEKVLRENDYKGGWNELSDDHLINRMFQEWIELHDAMIIRNRLNAKTTIDMQKECIDIANFAMMLFDNNERGKWMTRDEVFR